MGARGCVGLHKMGARGCVGLLFISASGLYGLQAYGKLSLCCIYHNLGLISQNKSCGAIMHICN